MSLSGRTPRVLFCTDTYPPQVNGVSVVTALSVTGLRDRGWRCAVVSPTYPDGTFDPFASSAGTPGAEDEHATVPSVSFPPYPEIRLAAPYYGRIARMIERFRPDLVHCETEFLIGRLGQIAARRAGIPLVTSYHTDFSRYTEAYGAPWLRGAVSRYIARFHRRALRTYTPGSPARSDLLALGVRDVEVWGRGVDVDIFHPHRRSAALRSALGAEGKTLFVHVGRLAAEKNVETILRGYALAASLLPVDSTRLVIAGSGPHEETLRARAPRGVLFLGHLDRKRRLPELYATADALLFSSLTETLGLVVLEAMASGIPVIATPAGGVADHLRHEVNGLAYDANDENQLAHAMVRLAMDRVLYDRLSGGARRTAEAMSWHAELDRLGSSYLEVCERARATARESRGELATTAA